MIATNFQIKDSIYIEYQGECFDLHNNYDFSGYHEDKSDKSISLNWQLGKYDWVTPDQAKSIKIILNKVSKFIITPGRSDASNLDQITLEEISYLTEAEWCDGPFITPWPPENIWDWVFMFESDVWFTINAESATVNVYP